MIAPKLLMFAPETWGQVEKFRHFYAGTHTFNARNARAVSGIEAHFDKSMRLQSIVRRLAPGLAADEAELEAQGFTPANNARELATVIEAAILELYSSVDCTVKVLHAIYGAKTRGFGESTRKLFQSVEKLGDPFPAALKPIFANPPWYRELLHLRDELTHLATGSLHLDEAKTAIRYMHTGITVAESPLIIVDVVSWLDGMTQQVNNFLGQVFQYLNTQLSDKPVMQICGMVDGRMLLRYVSPVANISFDSGSCGSRQWIDQVGFPTCPFKERCGAYASTVPAQS